MPDILIVGAGPAGATLAYLLAHRGFDVTLLERQSDFSREFRGEILMPSGALAIQDMGLGEAMERVPKQAQESMALYMNGRRVFRQELTGDVFGENPFQAISQTGFLETVVAEAGQSPRFRLVRGASVKDLLFEGDRVVGVRARTETGEENFRADLVVGADGRASVVRKRGGFTDRHVSPPLDVVWWKVPCPEDWSGVCGFMGKGHLLLAYRSWDGKLQIAWIIVKGSFRELKNRSMHEWAEEMAAYVSPELAAHLRNCEKELEKPVLLDAVSDCVERWSIPGALLVGDAAHTMSPVGGQGINIALRDSIVAANHLVPALHSGNASELDAALGAIERERMPEVKHIQRLQGLPPKIVFNSAWWSEIARTVAARLLAHPGIRAKVATQATEFPFGVTDVRLEV